MKKEIYTAGQFSKIAKKLSGFSTFEYVCVKGRYVFKIFNGVAPLASRYQCTEIKSSGLISVYGNKATIISTSDNDNELKDEKKINAILKK